MKTAWKTAPIICTESQKSTTINTTIVDLFWARSCTSKNLPFEFRKVLDGFFLLLLLSIGTLVGSFIGSEYFSSMVFIRWPRVCCSSFFFHLSSIDDGRNGEIRGAFACFARASHIWQRHSMHESHESRFMISVVLTKESEKKINTHSERASTWCRYTENCCGSFSSLHDQHQK